MNLLLELVLRAAEGFKSSTVIAIKGVLSSHEVFCEGQPTYHGVPRQGKTDPRMDATVFLLQSRLQIMVVYSHDTTLAPVIGASDYPGPGGRGENCRTRNFLGVCAYPAAFPRAHLPALTLALAPIPASVSTISPSPTAAPAAANAPSMPPPPPRRRTNSRSLYPGTRAQRRRARALTRTR